MTDTTSSSSRHPSTSSGQRLQQGLAAQNAGKLDEARKHYLEAARLLHAEARSSASAAVRRERYAQGQRVLDKAKEIGELLAQQAEKPAGRVRAEPDAEAPPWLLAERPSVRFDDVAGLDDVKEQIFVKLIHPFTHPEEARRFGIRPGGGLLLYGPPGTGKTYIARAVAGELDAAFFVARSSDLMSQWFGKAEQNIAALFAAARKERRSVIFLDEVEALVPKRSSSGSSVMPRVVAEFLSQTQSIGGESENAVLLMGATNEPWAIDPAALRPGRFDELIYVGLPDYPARLRLLELNLADRPLAAGLHLDALAELTEGYSGADIAYLCTKASERAFLDAVEMNWVRSVELSDFQAVLAERRPSVTPDQLRKYETFRRTRQAG